MAGYFELLAEMKNDVDNTCTKVALILSVVADWKKIYTFFFLILNQPMSRYLVYISTFGSLGQTLI